VGWSEWHFRNTLIKGGQWSKRLLYSRMVDFEMESEFFFFFFFFFLIANGGGSAIGVTIF